ncbi:expressed unknown protein [Seminavis robusta]|uniref:Uncharacterized protein n=1 Tax=Seminavis robusta TaxID=568900 RepID=A0A9N8DAB2_9STRA|nr:expressed unknown protein [Seminavis robusta]|eukprot:Sro58_g033620.1 n/a (277) ;mRNA; f:23995-24825
MSSSNNNNNQKRKKNLNPFYIDQSNGNGSYDNWDDYADYRYDDNDEEEVGLLGHDVQGNLYSSNNSNDYQNRRGAPVPFGRRFFAVLGLVALLVLVFVSLGGESQEASQSEVYNNKVKEDLDGDFGDADNNSTEVTKPPGTEQKDKSDATSTQKEEETKGEKQDSPANNSQTSGNATQKDQKSKEGSEAPENTTGSTKSPNPKAKPTKAKTKPPAPKTKPKTKAPQPTKPPPPPNPANPTNKTPKTASSPTKGNVTSSDNLLNSSPLNTPANVTTP